MAIHTMIARGRSSESIDSDRYGTTALPMVLGARSGRILPMLSVKSEEKQTSLREISQDSRQNPSVHTIVLAKYGINTLKLVGIMK